jgi:hypothetical protein
MPKKTLFEFVWFRNAGIISFVRAASQGVRVYGLLGFFHRWAIASRSGW